MQHRFGVPLPACTKMQRAGGIDGFDAQYGILRQPRMLIERQVVDPVVPHIPDIGGKAGHHLKDDSRLARRNRIYPGSHLCSEEPLLAIQKKQPIQIRLEHIHVERGGRLAAGHQRVAQPFPEYSGVPEAVHPQPPGRSYYDKPAIRFRADPAGQRRIAKKFVALKDNAVYNERIGIRLSGTYPGRSIRLSVLSVCRTGNCQNDSKPGCPKKKDVI